MFNHCIVETKCIVSLCELCVYKADQTPKLLAVLHAIETLATSIKEGGAEALKGSDHIRKEIVATGRLFHIQLINFLDTIFWRFKNLNYILC